MLNRSKLLLCLCFSLILQSGCIYLSGEKSREKIAQIPLIVADQISTEVIAHKLIAVLPTQRYSVRRFELSSRYGDITIDYFQIRERSSPELILIFPILGGKNRIENYFADVLARAGFESAIVHRNDEFKNPALFSQIETVVRNNTMRDIVTLNFFEKEFKKKVFGGFGLSRGAMNLVITAGNDARLQYNFLALGGASIAKVVRSSKEKRIKAYVENLSRIRQSSVAETLDFLDKTLVSEPYVFAQKLNPQNTMLVLGVFDSTVPFSEGVRLRRLLGNPATLFLFSGHATSLLYSQFFGVMIAGGLNPLLPIPYIESEVINFFSEKMRPSEARVSILPFRFLQAPTNILAELLS